MQIIDRFRAAHVRIRADIDGLMGLLTTDQLGKGSNADIARRLLGELAERIREHLSEEDRRLYPSLLINQDPRVKAVAWGFVSGERPLRRLFDDYNRRWLAPPELDCSGAFVQETREMMGLILDRIEREEQLLFPKLEQVAGLEDRTAS